jgi:hypothetical protein
MRGNDLSKLRQTHVQPKAQVNRKEELAKMSLKEAAALGEWKPIER